MNYYILAGAILLIILVSIQYSINKILIELKDIKKILMKVNIKK